MTTSLKISTFLQIDLLAAYGKTCQIIPSIDEKWNKPCCHTNRHLNALLHYIHSIVSCSWRGLCSYFAVTTKILSPDSRMIIYYTYYLLRTLIWNVSINSYSSTNTILPIIGSLENRVSIFSMNGVVFMTVTVAELVFFQTDLNVLFAVSVWRSFWCVLRRRRIGICRLYRVQTEAIFRISKTWKCEKSRTMRTKDYVWFGSDSPNDAVCCWA